MVINMHIRRLQLYGRVCNRTPSKLVQSYYSWPRGKEQSDVEEIIRSFKRAFCNVTVQLEHMYLD